MYRFKGRNGAEVWFLATDTLLGQYRSVGNVLEFAAPVAFEMENPRERLISFSHGGSNPIYPYIEALWILAGYDEPDMPMHYNRFPMQFVNPNTGLLDGAYGPRLVGIDKPDCYDELKYQNQLYTCVERLRENPNTRRAVCTISNPQLDWDNSSLDIPCTMSYQFLIRDGKLDMITNMRSQDLIKGFPNDTTEFQWIQEIIAGLVGCDVGSYYHIVGSLHIYESDLKIAKELLKYDRGHVDLYDIVQPLDARLAEPGFREYLKLILNLEKSVRLRVDDWPKVLDKIDTVLGEVKNKFYSRLMRCIIAYNLNKSGYLEEAYNLIKSVDSDIAYILRNRWKDVVE